MKVTDTKTFELTFHKTCDGLPSHSCKCLTKSAGYDTLIQVAYSTKHQAFNAHDSLPDAEHAMACSWWAELPAGEYLPDECLPDEDSVCDASETPSKPGVCIDEPDSIYDKFADAVERISYALHTFVASESTRAAMAAIQSIAAKADEDEKIAEAHAMKEPTGFVDLAKHHFVLVTEDACLDPVQSIFLCFAPNGISKGDQVVFRAKVPTDNRICTLVGRVSVDNPYVNLLTKIPGIVVDRLGWMKVGGQRCPPHDDYTELERCLGRPYSWHCARKVRDGDSSDYE